MFIFQIRDCDHHHSLQRNNQIGWCLTCINLRKRWGTYVFFFLLAFNISCTTPNQEYEALGSNEPCTPGQRTCQDQVTQVCNAQGSFINERRCPELSSCENGICVPSGPECHASCEESKVCTIFVNPTSPEELANFCIDASGTQPGGSPCTYSDECQSGLCLKRGDIAFCYQACTSSKDCPDHKQKCQTLTVTINGVQGVIKGCTMGL